MQKLFCCLGAGALALGLAAGSALASQQFTAGTQVVATQLNIGGFALPIVFVAPPNGADQMMNISIGRDDLSPFASVAVAFGPANAYYNGGFPLNVHHFIYRPWSDPLLPNPPRIAGTGGGRLGDLAQHFELCDIFARHAERMRTNWGTTNQAPSQPYSMYLWCWAGFPVPNPLPPPAQPGWGMGLAINEFYKYEVIY